MFEESIDHCVEFHQPLIFAHVILWLGKDAIHLSVRATDVELTRLLKGSQDESLIQECRYRNSVFRKGTKGLHLSDIIGWWDARHEARFDRYDKPRRCNLMIEAQIPCKAHTRYLAFDRELRDSQDFIRELLALCDHISQIGRRCVLSGLLLCLDDFRDNAEASSCPVF